MGRESWKARVYEYASDSDSGRLEGAEMLVLGPALVEHVSLWLRDRVI